ncbi:MAG: GIY-YIG nuclease family protein, partial [Lachnospiraceae bacterium]|nr:GIY-YIG nuclease family protein [Lachnospiraceae bacterium]
MWVADRWTDYRVLDASGGEKLEQWGPYRLIRPDPQVIWNTPKGADWKRVNAHYHRSSKGGGSWDFFDLPETFEKRVAELQTGNPNEIWIHSYYETMYPAKIEKMLHGRHATSNV